MKPKVYIETSVVSYLTARRSNDVRTIALQNATVEWWETRRQYFEAVVSEFVLAEAGEGHPEAAQRRLAALSGLIELEATESAWLLGQALIQQNALPAKAEIDAYHVAMAAVNGIEYRSFSRKMSYFSVLSLR